MKDKILNIMLIAICLILVTKNTLAESKVDKEDKKENNGVNTVNSLSRLPSLRGRTPQYLDPSNVAQELSTVYVTMTCL